MENGRCTISVVASGIGKNARSGDSSPATSEEEMSRSIGRRSRGVSGLRRPSDQTVVVFAQSRICEKWPGSRDGSLVNSASMYKYMTCKHALLSMIGLRYLSFDEVIRKSDLMFQRTVNFFGHSALYS